MAKQIQSVNVWVNGEVKVAEYLQVTGINDNYESSATNYWQMFTMIVDVNGIEEMGEAVASGNLTIDGASYVEWGDVPAMSVNAWIYNWVAEQLNLTIIS